MTGSTVPQSVQTSRERTNPRSRASMAVSRATSRTSSPSEVERQRSQYAFGMALRKNDAMRAGMGFATSAPSGQALAFGQSSNLVDQRERVDGLGDAVVKACRSSH